MGDGPFRQRGRRPAHFAIELTGYWCNTSDWPSTLVTAGGFFHNRNDHYFTSSISLGRHFLVKNDSFGL